MRGAEGKFDNGPRWARHGYGRKLGRRPPFIPLLILTVPFLFCVPFFFPAFIFLLAMPFMFVMSIPIVMMHFFLDVIFWFL